MTEIFPTLDKPKGNKIYRGAYNYYLGSSVYSEEVFEVYRDRKESSLQFVSEINSRVSTGELLNIKTNYHVNKDFIPQKVIIDRSLGAEVVREEWSYNKRKDLLTYQFKEKLGTTEIILPTTPKFHITTPTTTTSMLFLRSKKFDPTGKNVYTLWQSFNQWSYEKKPVITTVNIKKISTTAESMNLEGQNVLATQYRLFQNVNEDKEVEKSNDDAPSINIYLSKHLAIPYLLRSETDNTKIQIKYMNNLDSEIS